MVCVLCVDMSGQKNKSLEDLEKELHELERKPEEDGTYPLVCKSVCEFLA